MDCFCEETCFLLDQKLVITKKLLRVGKLSGKYDTLTVQEKQRSHKGNKTKITLKMYTWQIEIEANQLKTVKMRSEKQTVKENNYDQI